MKRNTLEYFKNSVTRQKAILSASIPLTPVDNFPIYNELAIDTSYLHGLYASDKKKDLDQQKNSKIQFSGRRRITSDINKIHDMLCSMLDASAGSLRLLSGLHAHVVVFMALAKIGDKVLLLSEEAGGHFATHGILERLGLKVYNMPVDLNSMCIDQEQTIKLINSICPKFIFVDRSEGLKFEDFSFISRVSGPIKIFDASQYLPQIMHGIYENPISWGFDLMLFTLHKSYPGPQKAGIVAKNNGYIWEKVLFGLGELVSSSHIENTYNFGLTLLQQTKVKNIAFGMLEYAKILEEELIKKGIFVQRSYSQGEKSWPRTQHIWIRCKNKLEAYTIYNNLSRARIMVNYRLLPYGLGWGIRLGTTSLVTLGFNKKEIIELADIISKVIKNGYTIKYRHIVRDIRENTK